MKNANVDDWRSLYESRDLGRARMVATCLDAMEFDVRLCCGCHDEVIRCDATRGDDASYAVEVQARDLAHLAEIVEEIIDEQDQFDLFMARWHARSRHAERRLLVAMIILLASLAAVGAIRL